MEPYNPFKLCPKCGNSQVTTFYCKGVESNSTSDICYKRGIRSEHLHRRCGRCHFEWLERCVDKTLEHRGGQGQSPEQEGTS